MLRFPVVALLAAVPLLAAPRVLLVTTGGDSHVAKGLTALGVEYETVTPGELGKRNPYAADVVFSDRDVARTPFTQDADLWREFVRLGGVFVGFRTNEQEPWLPVPLIHDRGYDTKALLVPEHPVFTTPHALDLAAVRAVHGGSIYHALAELGPGWVPLVEAGAPLGWDKRVAQSEGPHYGMAELVYGKGRILLTELIPAYHWFHDEKGDATVAGAKLFTNLVAYALASASEQAARRPPSQPLANAVRSLRELAPPPERAVGVDPEKGWTVTRRGPYTTKTDFRGVRTFLHADAPSQAGNFIQAATRLDLPPRRPGSPLVLQWYQSDTYCGGRERVLGGAQHGQTALENQKAEHRFKQVLVNGQAVWEEDVLGRNVQPAWKRFHTLDIAPFVKAGDREAEIALRVEDRLDSGTFPFFIEVFFARVALLGEELATNPLLGEEGMPAEGRIAGAGLSAAGEGALQAATPTQATWRVDVPPGQYRVALQAVDSPDGIEHLRLNGGKGPLGEWRLTANDGRAWWLLSDPVELGKEELAIEFVATEPPLVLLRVALVPWVAAPAKVGAAAPPVAVAVPLTLSETAGIARQGEISAQTVPLPEGVLHDSQRVRLLAADGSPVVVQTRPVALWADGSIKILQTCFPATLPAGGNAEFRLEAPAASPAEPGVALGVRERGGSLEVDTGAIRVELSTSHGRIADAVYRGGERLTPAGGVWEMVLETEDGSLLRSNAATVASTRIVEAGPCRALIVRRGWFAREDGSPSRLEYRIQTECFAGSEELRTQVFLVNRDDAAEVYLSRWSLDLAWERAAAGRVRLGERELQARNGAVLYQHRENQVSWTGEEPLARETGASDGLVRLPGLVFGSRWFWQRFPQAIRFADDRVSQDFVPRPLDADDLPTEWAERMAATTEQYPVGGIGYPQSPGKMGLFRVARGQALRQELLFRFTADPVPVDQLLHRLDAPLRAHADADYVAGTRAYGPFLPRNERLYPAYEASVGTFYERYLAKRRQRREYGFENYGDDTFEWGYGPSFTYWSNSEYDHHHGFALEYLRGGESRWWNEFEKTARMYADVVVIHHEEPGSRPQRGGPRHHNATALWMPSHERQAWIADHTRQGADSGHSWAEGVVDYWFLTGEPWAEEVAREMADWYVRIVAQNRYGAGGQERGPGWALIALSALAGATNDERVLAAGQTVADWIATWQDPVRGVLSVPISEQPSYEGGTVFMHGIVARGLGRWHGVTGDPRTRQALLGVADWLLTEPMGEPGRFWYKQAPTCMKGYSGTDLALNAFAYASHYTGEERYGRVADILLASAGASVRSMPWYPQVFGLLADRRQPVLVERKAERAVTAPGFPAVLAFTLRNTSGQPLRVTPHLNLPDGFVGPTPPVFSLAADGEQSLTVELTAEKAGLEGEATLRLELVLPDGTAHQRSIPFSVRSVAGIDRRHLRVAEAEVQAPMHLVGAGESAYVDDPRPEPFSGNPLPPDTDLGGKAVWTVTVAEARQFVLWAEVKWLDDKGNSFHFSLDGQPESALGNTGAMGAWIWVKGPTLDLAPGTHRLQVRTREEGAKLGGLWLTNLPDDAPPPPRR